MRITFRTDGQEVTDRRSTRQDAPRSFRIVFLLIVGISLLAVLGSFVGDGGLTILYQQTRVKADLQARIFAEQTRRQRLVARVDNLKNDPFELERVAREELGLVREREIVFDFRTSGPR